MLAYLERGLNILFLTDNFPPESNAPATRTFEHARHWVRAGHRVTVITGAPNFPEGRLYEGYRNRWYATEAMEGIRVVRVKTYIAANRGFGRRTLDYLSFMVASFVAGLFQPRPDVVIGTSPQFFTVCSAWLLAACRRRPFVFELRDLWPESIAAVGAMRPGFWLRRLAGLARFLYRRAAAIVCVTEAFRERLVAMGIAPQKVHVVLGGVETEHFRPQPRDAALAREHGLEGRFVVGFLGTHGLAHGLDAVLDCAVALRDRDDIAFLFVGSGASRARLVARAGELGLPNVRMLPRQPRAEMPRLWSLCDVSLITLRNDPLFATVIPSKIFESMAMGLPILIAVPAGEATRLVEGAGAGIALPPEDPAALARAVRHWAEHPEQRARFAAASAAAAGHYARGRQAGRMLEVLRGVAGRADKG